MAVIFAIAFVIILIVGARAGNASPNRESASNVLCPLCRTYLPCNCNRHEDTSYGHHHRDDQWSRDSMNHTLQDDSRQEHSHHHREYD